MVWIIINIYLNIKIDIKQMAMFIPYSLITHGLYTGLVSTIGTVTFGTCKLIKSMYSHKNPDVSKVIKELDIERKLKMVQSVINLIHHSSKNNEVKIKLNDLEKTQIFELVSQKQYANKAEDGYKQDISIDFDDPIELSLYYLQQTIQDIHNDLDAINQKVTRYNAKWFKSWRTLNVQSLLDNLILNAKILDLRYDDLIKIFSFLKNKK